METGDDTELGIAMAEQGGLEKGKEAKLAAAAASYIGFITSGDDRCVLRFLSSVVDNCFKSTGQIQMY